MTRHPPPELAFPETWLPRLQAPARPPVAVGVGSPRQVVELVRRLSLDGAVLYQMDLYQAEKLTQLAQESGLNVRVVTHADLWDLPRDFQTVLFPVEPRGERM